MCVECRTEVSADAGGCCKANACVSNQVGYIPSACKQTLEPNGQVARQGRLEVTGGSIGGKVAWSRVETRGLRAKNEEGGSE